MRHEGSGSVGHHVVLVLFLCLGQARVPHAQVAQSGFGLMEGVVVEFTTGQPIAGATVTAQSNRRLSSTAVETDSKGCFRFDALPVDAYELLAEKDGYSVGVLWWRDLHPGERLTGLRLTMRQFAEVEGVVVDQYGDPVWGVTVLLVGQSWNGGRAEWYSQDSADTDSTGQFAIRNVFTGDYRVLVAGLVHDADSSEVPLRAVPVTFYPGVPTLAEAAVVTMRGRESRSMLIRVEVTPSVALSGQVVGGPRPLRGINVFLAALPLLSCGREWVVPVGAEGTFTSRLPPGVYRLQVAAAPASTDDRSPLYADEEVTLASSQRSDLKVALQAAPTVRGVVRFLDAEPASQPEHIDVELDEVGPNVGSISTQVDSTRSFRADVPPGRYVVSATGVGWSLADAQLDGQSVTDHPFDVSSAGISGLEVTLTRRGSSISGRVMSVYSFADLFVAAFPTDWASADYVNPRRFVGNYCFDGAFDFPLPPGTYYVVAVRGAEDIGIRWDDPAHLSRLAALATRLVLRRGEALRVTLKVATLDGLVDPVQAVARHTGAPRTRY